MGLIPAWGDAGASTEMCWAPFGVLPSLEGCWAPFGALFQLGKMLVLVRHSFWTSAQLEDMLVLVLGLCWASSQCVRIAGACTGMVLVSFWSSWQPVPGFGVTATPAHPGTGFSAGAPVSTEPWALARAAAGAGSPAHRPAPSPAGAGGSRARPPPPCPQPGGAGERGDTRGCHTHPCVPSSSPPSHPPYPLQIALLKGQELHRHPTSI